MEKIILYYKFVPVTDPVMTMRWQKELCARLELKGRIIVAAQGINGTLGGKLENLLEYKREMNRSVLFKGITYKWSDGGQDYFPKLSVKVKPELVAFDAAVEIKIDQDGVRGGGKRLKPAALHKLIEERGEDVVFFDGRNKYEAQVGRFKNAVVPNVTTSRDFIKEIGKPKYNKFKDKPVVTYCTGGIRCEVLSTLMKNRGFKDVYQLDGGIVKYGEKYGDKGFWEGKLFIFDNRMKTAFSDESKDIASCEACAKPTSNLVNSTNVRRKLHVVCEDCVVKPTQATLISLML